MAITQSRALAALRTSKKLYCAYSGATKMPYVTCDPGSFNDQVWIFSTEEGVKAFGMEKAKEKNLIAGMCVEKKDFMRLYSTFFSIGATSVMYCDEGQTVELELSALVKQADFSAMEPSKRPLFNPALQLCGLYFLQEMRRPVPIGEKPKIRELEEEMLVNLKRAEFLVPMEISEGEEKKISVPLLKNQKGDMMQPAFTDIMEMQKFAGKKKMRAVKVPFERLAGMLVPDAKYLIINPMGFSLPLSGEHLKKITESEL